MSRSQEAADSAAGWIIRQENGDWSNAAQAELDAWLAASDGNKAAYWRLRHSWQEADRIRALGVRGKLPAPFPMQRFWKPAALAASIALVAAIGFQQFGDPLLGSRAPLQSYSAATGEHRSVALADGSRVELNTGSTVRAARREIWLDRGEAFFEVAHDPGQPFIVHAGSKTVTVLGTKFSVRREGGDVTVAVLEGRVRIDDTLARGSSGTASTIITGGVTAISHGASTLVTQRSSERVGNALAWREGMLVFDQVTLAEAAAEFNRYHKRPIIVTDPDAANIRIGGTFEASNAEGFAGLLRDAYGMRVSIEGDAIRISD